MNHMQGLRIEWISVAVYLTFPPIAQAPQEITSRRHGVTTLLKRCPGLDHKGLTQLWIYR
jgi:hypothetical protein